MTKIDIKQDHSSFRLDLDLGEFVCAHSEVSVEKACCAFPGPSGYYECGCGGSDEITCDNPDCTGIEDYEYENIYQSIAEAGQDCWE